MSDQKISNPTPPFIAIPKLYDVAGLDVYEFRLLVHYAGVGNCWESTKTTAKNCKMGINQVKVKRQSLKVKGFITFTVDEEHNGTWNIGVVDKWAENAEMFRVDMNVNEGSYTSVRGGRSHVNGSGGTHSYPKEEPIEEEPIKKNILSTWGKLFPNKTQPKLKTLNTKMTTRLRNSLFLEKWHSAMLKASRSPALIAEGWFQLRWLVHNDENFQKVLDGTYDFLDEKYSGKNVTGDTSNYQAEYEANKIKAQARNRELRQGLET